VLGILNINKPSHLTSRDVVTRVVQAVRQATGTKVKAGHAGTLDPQASGVLVICIGKATRLIQFVQQYPKTYVAEFQLDVTSLSADLETDVVGIDQPARPSVADVTAALPKFLGKIQQVPPAYSAVSVNGQRAYQLARRGIDVELAAKEVEIHKLEINAYRYPTLNLTIECGSGTYVRSLGRDLAKSLQSDAVMSNLVRTRIGPFDLEHSLQMSAIDYDSIQSNLIDASLAVDFLPKVRLSNEEHAAIKNGRFIDSERFEFGKQLPEKVVATINNDLVAILEPRSGQLKPVVNFS
jgi:tRNA pseudouridine55 synthase